MNNLTLFAGPTVIKTELYSKVLFPSTILDYSDIGKYDYIALNFNIDDHNSLIRKFSSNVLFLLNESTIDLLYLESLLTEYVVVYSVHYMLHRFDNDDDKLEQELIELCYVFIEDLLTGINVTISEDVENQIFDSCEDIISKLSMLANMSNSYDLLYDTLKMNNIHSDNVITILPLGSKFISEKDKIMSKPILVYTI